MVAFNVNTTYNPVSTVNSFDIQQLIQAPYHIICLPFFCNKKYPKLAVLGLPTFKILA